MSWFRRSKSQRGDVAMQEVVPQRSLADRVADAIQSVDEAAAEHGEPYSQDVTIRQDRQYDHDWRGVSYQFQHLQARHGTQRIVLSVFADVRGSDELFPGTGMMRMTPAETKTHAFEFANPAEFDEWRRQPGLGFQVTVLSISILVRSL